ncbi:MAG: urate hydroxylase PuuD [Chloroflexota bacterium]|nr:urate hydroxylase PuuD [Chloroflexota bacterium]
MNVLDWILLAIRWAHALGAVAWVGGGIFYLMVLRPAFQRRDPGQETHRAIGEEFRGLVNTAIVVLIVTGAILTASRLTLDTVTLPYVAVLVIKVTLALYMMAVMRFRRHRRAGAGVPHDVGRLARVREVLTGPTALLVIGVIIFGLADVLGYLFENSLAG